MAELFTNNATSTLASGIGTGDLSLSVQSGDGALFPAPTSPDFFRAVLFKRTTGQIEIVLVTARSSDVFTITRGQEGTSPLALNAGDLVELRPTAGFFSSLSVTSLAVQSNTFNTAGADSGSANTYVVSLSPAPTSYVAGLSLVFVPANSNTGASTINVNGLGLKNILRNDGVALSAGDIVANRPTEIRYDGTQFRLQHSGIGHAATATSATTASNADQLDSLDSTAFALAGAGVSGGNSHDHSGGDGAQIPESGLAAAVQAKLVTGGNSHDHSGGDGATIDHAALSNTGTATGHVTGGDSHDHAGGDGQQIPTAGLADKCITPAKLRDAVTGTKVSASADTERSTASVSYVPLKEIYTPYGGTFSIYFEHKIDNGTGCARIYVNGSPVGTERCSGSLSYVPYTEDITVSAGALIQLYVKHNSGGANSYVQNFRVREATPLVFTVNSN